MANKDKRYLNFPIILLKDIYINTSEVLDNIMDYAIYKHTLSLECGEDLEKMYDAAKYFRITLRNVEKCFANGSNLYNSIPKNIPMSGIEVNMLFDFYQNDKSHNEVVLLAAFLALKSIVGTKPFCKTNKDLVLSRMAGNAKKEYITDYLKQYEKEYHWKKLIRNLEINWCLKYYSRYMRGFYFSFDLELPQLIEKSEALRGTNKQKEFIKNKSVTIKRTLKQLKK